MNLSEETLAELEDIRESLETVAGTDFELGETAQALLDELDSSEGSA